MNESRPATVFCIDGSGNKNQKAADRQRPIHRLDVAGGAISRPLLEHGDSATQSFAGRIADEALPKPVLIAADLPLGLPAQPSDVFEAVGVRGRQLESSPQDRDGTGLLCGAKWCDTTPVRRAA